MPLLSGKVLRHAGHPTAANGGKPNPGLLGIQFKAGDKARLYRPTIELVTFAAVARRQDDLDATLVWPGMCIDVLRQSAG